MNTRLQVTFQTDFFKPVAGEEAQTNPGRYGRALAQWLAEKLRERGVALEGIVPEDFGWMVMVSHKPFKLWLACANTEGSRNEWSVFPVAEASMVQRLLRRINPASEVEKLRVHLVELVPSIPGVSNVSWE